MIPQYNKNRPPQKIPFAKKTKKWRIDNVDFGEKFSFYNNEETRSDLKRKIRNFNLYNGITDIEDMVNVVNPHSIEADFIPNSIPHVPILVPKIDLLVGEEIKRRFDFKVITTNQDAISQKEEEVKGYLNEQLTQLVKSKYKDEELQKKLEELNSFIRLSWSDAREKLASTILKHYWEALDMKSIFSEGFKHALIVGEETYQIETLHGEPTLTLLNPLKVHTIQSGNSDRIEDSQLIIIEDHWSPGKVIDVFHDQLKPKDIDELMEASTTSGEKRNYTDDENSHLMFDNTIEEMLGYASLNGHNFSKSFTDENGNIRILRVYWKSLKRIKKIKYYDEDGEVQFKLRSEEYLTNEQLGEEETSFWVNEWWEGTKIGKDLYLNMKPMDVQYNKIDNPSYCHPGIIGQIYNTNQGKAVGLVDRAISLQYYYDVINDRTNKAIANNHGKILELDIAKVPENWDVEKWLHFAFVNKIAVVDSFKVGSEGPSTGKLAGGMSGLGGRVLDLETGNYIQQHIALLDFIKNEMGEITGVSSQRQGQIENRETVGGIERSVTQSSHITEYWFFKHENLKLRVLKAFIEAAKFALKGKSKKVQYILDEYSIQMLNIEGDNFSENDYDILVTNSQKVAELEQMLKRYAETMVQTTGSLKTIMDIWLSPSISEMRRKIEEDEIKRSESAAAAQKEQNEILKEQQEYDRSLKERELSIKEDELILKKYEIDAKLDNELQDKDRESVLKNRELDITHEKNKTDAANKEKEISVKRQQKKT